MTPGLSRRAWLAGAAAAMVACRREDRPPAPARSSPPSPSAPPPPPAAPAPPAAAPLFSVRELEFAATPPGFDHAEKAAVVVPGWGAPGEKFPVLVALHGRGEAVRGLDVGAWAWMRDYELGRTITRLREPPLTRADLRGFADDRRLAKINASLADRPFRGLVVVCPWVPDVLDDTSRGNLDAALPFGGFVVDTLLPRVVSEAPALAAPASTGIDGVSLGGRVALVVGLANAARFCAVGSLQAAVQASEAAPLAARAQRAIAAQPKLRLRLLTSDADYFRNPIGALHESLAAASVPHEHVTVPGPHDYPFNRGPGGVEMLLFHDRVLRGEPPL